MVSLLVFLQKCGPFEISVIIIDCIYIATQSIHLDVVEEKMTTMMIVRLLGTKTVAIEDAEMIEATMIS
jgi:hypothetical protein